MLCSTSEDKEEAVEFRRGTERRKEGRKEGNMVDLFKTTKSEGRKEGRKEGEKQGCYAQRAKRRSGSRRRKGQADEEGKRKQIGFWGLK